ncbi:MAG: DUF86 domain-containing protein [Candidatus Hydrogenedentota bacterium]|nr:MAG: DUF86 domain-containing protein [Candidatus Hydrogenedentota bacterium]
MSAVRLRNLTVHNYDKLDMELAYMYLKTGLNDFKLFVEAVDEVLRKWE